LDHVISVDNNRKSNPMDKNPKLENRENAYA
jgi:hypothetical protein